MFHSDIHGKLKDTEEVKTPREGQPMQSMDDLPSRQSLNQQPTNEQPRWETQGERVPGSQDPRLEQETEPGQANTYQNASEQMTLPYPPVPASYQQGSAQAPSGPLWTAYPPRPEQYQSGTFGQPGQYSAPASTPPVLPGQLTSGATLPPPYGARRSGLHTGAILALVALLAAVFGTGLFAGWQFWHTSGSSTTPSANTNVLQPGNNSNVTVPQLTENNMDTVREAVINKVQPGIVQLNVVTASARALGSGVIIDGRGYIVTNNHVVSNASSIQATLFDGTVLPATVVSTDPADDVAVIKVTPPSSGLTVVSLGDSSRLRVGQTVLAIGSPLGNTETVTGGIVSALNRNISEGQNGATLPDAIQTDAPINPGNSGGALVDMQGNLVGIPTLNAIDTEFNTPANGLGFAIPVNRVKFVATQIIADGRVTHTGRSILGITVASVDANLAARNQLSTNSGALIESVTASGPSASAGLKTGDVIVQIGNKTIHNITDLGAALLQHKPGEAVPVKIYRGSQQLTINVALGELPVS